MKKESSGDGGSHIRDDLKSPLPFVFLRERLMDGEYGMSSEEANAVARWYQERMERCGESGRLADPAEILQEYLDEAALSF